MRFAYLRDPLFLVCFVGYVVNRWVFKRIWTDGFVHEHFNDLVCIPFCVPIMLYLGRLVGIRRHDDPPDAVEIVVPVIVWSLAFELWLPSNPFFSRWSVADYRDIACYAAGALLASMIWNWRYRVAPSEQADVSAEATQSGGTKNSVPICQEKMT